MSETCPTIRVKSPVSDDNPSGYIVINEADKTDEHELYVEPGAEVKVPAETPKTGWKPA